MQKRVTFNRPEDPGSYEKASIFVKIVWSVIVVITTTFLISMVMLPENFLRYIMIIALIWTMSLFLLFSARKGFAYLSALLYIIFLLLMIFGFSWTGGGIKGHGIRLLPIVVLFAGLTLGKKEIWLFGLVASIGGLVLVMADHFQRIPIIEPLGNSALIYWVYSTTGILLLCILENFSVEKLRKALAKSREEISLRKRSEELLLEKNKKLVEIASFQSHMVRRPVASVLGIISMIKMDNPADPVNIEVIPRLDIAAKELDALIREIVMKTSEVEDIAQAMGELEDSGSR